MTRTLSIKNMVCDRCKATVKQALKNEGNKVESNELGQVKILEHEKNDLSPMIAALAMSFSSVSVIANALRLRRIKV